MRSWLCTACIVGATASVGCGGRLVPDRRLLPDGAVAPKLATSPDGGSDDGGATANDAGMDACAEIPAPLCAPTATCGQMFIRPGEGLREGYFRFETVDVPCRSPATVVQQRINGAWVQLLSLPDEWIPNTPSADTYILGSQFPLTTPQEGATVGSLQAIRGCTIAGACTSCDPPTELTVLQCGACLPKNCQAGKYLDEDCQCGERDLPLPARSVSGVHEAGGEVLNRRAPRMQAPERPPRGRAPIRRSPRAGRTNPPPPSAEGAP